MRIGSGFDVHALVTGRKLVLGGVEIEWPKGLDGHSDADVLVHAICDALLGAAALGDIGRHFSPDDPDFKDIDSRILLRRVGALLLEHGWVVGNLDATVIAEKPKLSPYLPTMIANLCSDLDIKAAQVSVKATTTEGLGYAGREEGIAAQAVALIIEAGK